MSLDLAFNGGSRGRAKTDAEFVCSRCNANCTRDPTTGTEYGHQFDCANRPSDLRPGRGPDAEE